MLTGDKLETAENIGESCRLLKKEMDVTRLSTKEDVKKFCNEDQIELNKQRLKDGKMKGLLVEASALELILQA